MAVSLASEVLLSESWAPLEAALSIVLPARRVAIIEVGSDCVARAPWEHLFIMVAIRC